MVNEKDIDYSELTREQLERQLSDKQRHFAYEYVKDWDATRAAIASGYSAKTARATSARLKVNPKIKAYIDLIKGEIAERIGLSKERVIEELSRIAFARAADLYEDWKTLADFQQVKEANPETLVAVKSIEFKPGKYGDTIKVTMHDKLAANQAILKAMGWNEPERVEVDTSAATQREKQKELISNIFPSDDELTGL